MKKFKLCLVIDDNDIDNFVVKILLERSSFAETVCCASGGNTALEIIRKLNGRILAGELNNEDICIFLDFEMPYLNGGGFAVSLEKMAPDLLRQTYMLSILSKEEQSLRMKQKPALRGFISKPLSEATLQTILNEQDSPQEMDAAL